MEESCAICFQAALWFRKAAEQVFADSSNNLAALFHHGWGSAPDYQAGIALVPCGGRARTRRGKEQLGVMYEDGSGVPKDYTEAARWYRAAAEQGDSDGQ